MHYGNKTINQVGFPAPVLKALRHANLNTLQQLCLMDGMEILHWRTNGQVVLKDMLQFLLQRCVRPVWYKTVGNAVAGDRETLSAPPEGWYQVLTECSKFEGWIIESTIADLERGGIKWAVVSTPDGRQMWRKGGVEIEPE